jgi:hypothetical protein
MASAAKLEDLLTEHDVARLLGRKLKTVQKDRLLGRGPRYLKIGRSVRYRPADIAAFIEICPSNGGQAIPRR